jgi:hypothetical protein
MMRSLGNNNNVLIVTESRDHNFNHSIIILKHQKEKKKGKKKGGNLHSMTQLLIGCMKIIFLILVATIFGLDSLALPKNTLPIVLLPFISCMTNKYT